MEVSPRYTLLSFDCEKYFYTHTHICIFEGSMPLCMYVSSSSSQIIVMLLSRCSASWPAQQGVLCGRVRLQAPGVGGEGGRVLHHGVRQAVRGEEGERVRRRGGDRVRCGALHRSVVTRSSYSVLSSSSPQSAPWGWRSSSTARQSWRPNCLWSRPVRHPPRLFLTSRRWAWINENPLLKAT